MSRPSFGGATGMVLHVGLKVKGLDIYIPPPTGKSWPAAVYNSKWLLTSNDRSGAAQVAAAHCPNGSRSLQPDRPTYAPASRTMATIPQCSPAMTHYF